MRMLLVGLAVGSLVMFGSSPNGEDIMCRTVRVTEANWAEAPNYAFTRTDVKSAPGSEADRRTFQVFMIEGSPFSRLVSVQGGRTPAADSQEREKTLRREMSKRVNESPRERRKRIDKYNEERNRDHAMLMELRNAFEYKVGGEQKTNGREVIVLNGIPKTDYIPTSRETKILSGMEVTFWIDKRTYQWRRVEADIKMPVSVYGMIGKVNPGTRFILDQEPISSTLWLPTHFQIQVRATALGFINQNFSREEIYRDYRRTGQQALSNERGRPKHSAGAVE
jgi:hypothetical protein